MCSRVLISRRRLETVAGQLIGTRHQSPDQIHQGGRAAAAENLYPEIVSYE